MRIAFQPCSAAASVRHYRDSVEHPVNIRKMAPLLGPDLTQTLLRLHSEGVAAMWGLTPGPSNLPRYETLTPGDLVLFAGSGRFFAQAAVTTKWRNPAVARQLWVPRTAVQRGALGS